MIQAKTIEDALTLGYTIHIKLNILQVFIILSDKKGKSVAAAIPLDAHIERRADDVVKYLQNKLLTTEKDMLAKDWEYVWNQYSTYCRGLKNKGEMKTFPIWANENFEIPLEI